MSNVRTPPDKPGARIGRAFLLVEWLAASVLVLVMLLIGWFVIVTLGSDWLSLASERIEEGEIDRVVVEAQTGWLRLASERIEVILILALLTAALLLVSVVALRHTRD